MVRQAPEPAVQAPRKLSRAQPPGTKMGKGDPQRVNRGPWAAKCASWLLFLAQNDLPQASQAALARMIEVEPLVATARQLAQEFLQLLRNRQVEALSAWLKRVHASGIEALTSFANSLENDLEAVCAACSLSWSNGSTEGNVNRLKLIKRQMYGRANFDLLRRRMLGMPAPP